jgi:hypothetical protein
VLRRKKVLSPFAHKYIREPHFTTIDGITINEGDLIKIKGEHGSVFRFKEFVQRTDSDTNWIDCYEMEKGLPCGLRSFRTERIKIIPKKRVRRRRKVTN